MVCPIINRHNKGKRWHSVTHWLLILCVCVCMCACFSGVNDEKWKGISQYLLLWWDGAQTGLSVAVIWHAKFSYLFPPKTLAAVKVVSLLRLAPVPAPDLRCQRSGPLKWQLSPLWRRKQSLLTLRNTWRGRCARSLPAALPLSPLRWCGRDFSAAMFKTSPRFTVSDTGIILHVKHS